MAKLAHKLDKYTQNWTSDYAIVLNKMKQQGRVTQMAHRKMHVNGTQWNAIKIHLSDRYVILYLYAVFLLTI